MAFDAAMAPGDSCPFRMLFMNHPAERTFQQRVYSAITVLDVRVAD